MIFGEIFDCLSPLPIKKFQDTTQGAYFLEIGTWKLVIPK